MPRLIGIDTGGTYTDAVVFDEVAGVLGKAKALTTRHDLSVGIGEAMDAAMLAATTQPRTIAMVSLSTTLATNAIVEGLDDRVGLVLIGLDAADLARAGLREALGGDPVLFLHGGHGAHGNEVAGLNTAPLAGWVEAAAAVSAFAVAGRFSTANPGHELAVRDWLLARTGKPVTCSHELSARLNAPKRALTSLLNARLIGTIHHLIDATQGHLSARGMEAPVMVVKGDGSLISAAEARLKPIETILSGPAASIVGASFLTGLGDALVSDIGGTTTDVALLKDGRPRLNAEGARVGGWSTMVQAVAMHTVGLGGDSEVAQASDTPGAPLRLGPRRVVPVSLLAAQFPDVVHASLDRLLSQQIVPEDAGRFAIASGRPGSAASESDVEAEILAAIAVRPVALPDLLATRRHGTTLRRLVARGAAQIAAFCPSDAAHVLGRHTAWDRAAAVKAATLLAGRRGARGEPLAADAEAISRAVIEMLVQRSAETLLDAAFAEDGDAMPKPSAHPLVQAAMRPRSGLVRLGIGLSVPVVALGASARTYYPEVAARLETDAVIPEHADVANAIGAVVGHIRVTATVLISRPTDGLFRAHLDNGPRDFTELAEAVACAESELRADVARRAAANGAGHIDTSISREENTVMLGSEPLFLEMRVTATGVGRPSLA